MRAHTFTSVGILMAVTGCFERPAPMQQNPTELCIAANPELAELAGYPPTVLEVRELVIRVPNEEVLIREARGETIRRFLGGENIETVHLDFDSFGSDKLCLYRRATGAWILDTPANTDRCNCWDPADGLLTSTRRVSTGL